MKIFIAEDNNDFNRLAYKQFKETLKANPEATFYLPTGSTPIGMYNNLVESYEAGKISFKDCKFFNLDEYKGLSKDNPNGYFYFLNDLLYSHVDADKKNINYLHGDATDTQKECTRYAKLMEENPADLIILGIGVNGHIGFNEPNTPFNASVREVQLTSDTINNNARFFNSINEVPTSALTIGFTEILRAKKILLLANGEVKADAIHKAIKEEVSPLCPASILQLHEDVTVILDKQSASKLND